MHEPNFEEIKDTIDSIIRNHNIDDEYKINQLELRMKVLAVSKTASAEWTKMIKLQNEYTVLLQKLNREATDVPTKPDELQQAVTDLYDELKQITMFEYVNRSLSSVMGELGYDVIGEETLIEQKAEKDYYDFSEHSVINISSSQSGVLMFEVMGKDSEHGSKAAVKSDMERFCPDYDKVKTGLKAYGIVLEREKLYEPDEKYVRFAGNDHIKQNSQRRVSQKKGLLYNNE